MTLQTSHAGLWAVGMCCVAALAGCRVPDVAEVEVEVRSVGFDSVSHAPVVVLQDHDRKVALPIWIGPAEAQAIAMPMRGLAAPRPMTHDLIKLMLDQVGIEFQKVVIEDVREGTYVASIFLHDGRRAVQIDSRPSDAIALAMRFDRPIFVATSLLTASATIDLQRLAPTGSMVTIAGVTVQNLTEDLAEYFSLPLAVGGVLVAAVAREAATALQRGDVILEVDGQAVSGVGDFDSKMRALTGGDARLSVQRGAQRVYVHFAAPAG